MEVLGWFRRKDHAASLTAFNRDIRRPLLRRVTEPGVNVVGMVAVAILIHPFHCLLSAFTEPTSEKSTAAFDLSVKVSRGVSLSESWFTFNVMVLLNVADLFT